MISYVEHPGELVPRHPVDLDDTIMYGFVLTARYAPLKALCDTVLNGPARGIHVYRPVPFVMAVCADIRRAQSNDPEHKRWGWSQERDYGFWIPVLRGKMIGPFFVPTKLVWFLPYVFIDNPSALAAGRETFGFPKHLGCLRQPTDPANPSQFTVETLSITKYDPNHQAQEQMLYSITRQNGAPPPPSNEWQTCTDAIEAALEAVCTRYAAASSTVLIEDMEGSARDQLEITAQLFRRQADLSTVSMNFLKQFRDADDPTKACYQAIVEAPSQLRTWKGGGPLDPYSIDIISRESHPIVADLGLAAPHDIPKFGQSLALQPFFSFWIACDFTLRRGTVLVSSC
jgi:hypothetical protein